MSTLDTQRHSEPDRLLDRHAGAIGRFAWFSAWFGLVIGQLHALSRHATDEGRSDLELAGTRIWAEPAADVLAPLLDWADPDFVYVTYGKLWLPVFVGFFLCALVVHRRRRPTGFEKWVWRVVLLGYGWATLAVGLEYWSQWSGEYNALFEPLFVVMLPAILITVLGSTVLGITLLVKGFRPRSSAWLLAATFPLALVVTEVTSMGNIVLPIAFAFGLLGRQVGRLTPGPGAAGS